MRIFFRRLGAAVLAAALVPLTADAATITADHVVVFGDSLSDTGRAHALTGGRIPASPPYARKRFSNGDVWVDHVRRDFRRAGGTVQNYAIGGATSIGVVHGQVAEFALRGERRANMAAVIFASHNDLKFIADARRGGSLGRRVADEASRTVARSIESHARTLKGLGIDKFVIFDAVDLGKIPRFTEEAPHRAGYATRASSIFNTTLDRALRRLRSDGIEVAKVEFGSLFEDALANPARYGLTNVTDRCLRRDGTICANPDEYLFWDNQHPTAAAHWHLARFAGQQLQPAGAQIAQVQVQVAPVPLPAPAILLLAALAGLAATARTRRI
jgi:outer membrane lipase/esterase